MIKIILQLEKRVHMNQIDFLHEPVLGFMIEKHHHCLGHQFVKGRYNRMPRVHRIERKLKNEWAKKKDILNFWTTVISDRPKHGKRHQVIGNYLHIHDHVDCNHYNVNTVYKMYSVLN